MSINKNIVFDNQTRIYEADDALLAAREMSEVNDRILIVTTSGGVSRYGISEDSFGGVFGRLCTSIKPNPDIKDLETQIEELKADNFTKIIAIGGGSVIDAAKVFSVALANYEPNILRQALLADNNSFFSRGLPLTAIPTMSGTGAEVTPFATVWDMADKKKYSLTGSALLPHIAIYDAKLTASMSHEQTLFTALDSISHALESMWNKNVSQISLAFSLRALSLMSDHLHDALNHPNDIGAREKVQKASMLAGMSISQTRTSLAHAVSYPLTYNFDVPHGLACSFMLAEMMGLHESELRNSGMSLQLFDRLRKMLLDFDLKAMLAAYLSREELEALIEDMMSNRRIGNYSGNISRALLTDLVLK